MDIPPSVVGISFGGGTTGDLVVITSKTTIL